MGGISINVDIEVVRICVITRGIAFMETDI